MASFPTALMSAFSLILSLFPSNHLIPQNNDLSVQTRTSHQNLNAGVVPGSSVPLGIVNGNRVEVNDAPWHVWVTHPEDGHLSDSDGFVCSGALVDPSTVVVSASCVSFYREDHESGVDEDNPYFEERVLPLPDDDDPTIPRDDDVVIGVVAGESVLAEPLVDEDGDPQVDGDGNVVKNFPVDVTRVGVYRKDIFVPSDFPTLDELNNQELQDVGWVDVAVLKLARPLAQSGSIRPIQISSSTSLSSGTGLLWGAAQNWVYDNEGGGSRND